MSDYLSRFTGQEIETILDSVSSKMEKTAVVDDATQSFSDQPASSRLVYEANAAIIAINEVLDNKVLKIDAGEQTINGRKVFAAAPVFNKGLSILSGSAITIPDGATNNTDAVNFKMLKDHGLSLQDSGDSGFKFTALSTGYLRVSHDVASLTTMQTTSAPDYYLAFSGGSVYRYDRFYTLAKTGSRALSANSSTDWFTVPKGQATKFLLSLTWADGKNDVYEVWINKNGMINKTNGVIESSATVTLTTKDTTDTWTLNVVNNSATSALAMDYKLFSQF